MQIEINNFYRCRNGIEVEIFDEGSTYSFGLFIDKNGKKQGSYWYQETGQYGPAQQLHEHDMDLVQKMENK
jgi:hypothetical protein